MNIQNKDSQTVVVTGLLELVAANAAQVRDEIRAALPATAVTLDFDLSAMTFLDSSGLGGPALLELAAAPIIALGAECGVKTAAQGLAAHADGGGSGRP